MLADRADKIGRQGIALVNVAADFADITFFYRGLGFGLDVALIISISHGFLIGNQLGFFNRANKHSVCTKVDINFYL